MFSFSTSPDIIEAFNISILLSNTVPIMVYNNTDLDKERIILDSKNKAGVYQFINLLTGQSYVGSSINLNRRLKEYYSYKYISSAAIGNSKICSSLLKNGYSNLSLTILEYCKEKDCTNREQFYIDVLKPAMNILQMAGNSLGYKHTPESLAKFSGENHSRYGKSHSAKTRALISLANSGRNNSMYGRSLLHSVETKEKMSAAKGRTIYLYTSDKSSLINTFNSGRKAAEYLETSHSTIMRYSRNGLVFKGQWILSTSLITKE
jgi:group I intron endonuclease